MRDLVVLVPDKNTEGTISGAVGRWASIGIREIAAAIIVEPGRDPAVRKRGPQVLRVETRQFRHAVMIFDYEGSGATEEPRVLESRLDAQLEPDWGDRAKAIVIDPEVDIWMWGAEIHLRQAVEWPIEVEIRPWLQNRGFTFGEHGKPNRPKEALEAVFGHVRVPRSSSYYRQLAQRLSLQNCTDASFLRLRTKLVEWFPTGPADAVQRVDGEGHS